MRAVLPYNKVEATVMMTQLEQGNREIGERSAGHVQVPFGFQPHMEDSICKAH